MFFEHMCASSGAFFNSLEAFLKVALEKRFLEKFQKETNMVSPMLRIAKNMFKFEHQH